MQDAFPEAYLDHRLYQADPCPLLRRYHLCAEAGQCGWHQTSGHRQGWGSKVMGPTTTADPSLIHDIKAFEESVAIHIYEGGIPTDQAKDVAAQAQSFRIRNRAGRASGSMPKGKDWGRLVWCPKNKISQPQTELNFLLCD